MGVPMSDGGARPRGGEDRCPAGEVVPTAQGRTEGREVAGEVALCSVDHALAPRGRERRGRGMGGGVSPAHLIKRRSRVAAPSSRCGGTLELCRKERRIFARQVGAALQEERLANLRDAGLCLSHRPDTLMIVGDQFSYESSGLSVAEKIAGEQRSRYRFAVLLRKPIRQTLLKVTRIVSAGG